MVALCVSPMPRTANACSVVSGCQLGKHGLQSDEETGELRFVENRCVRLCDGELRCGHNDTTIDVSCTFTAHQTTDLTATANLIISASNFSDSDNYLLLQPGCPGGRPFNDSVLAPCGVNTAVPPDISPDKFWRLILIHHQCRHVFRLSVCLDGSSSWSGCSDLRLVQWLLVALM